MAEHQLPSLWHYIRRFLVIFTVLALALGIPFSLVDAQDARDCDNNAVIRCGISSTSDISRAYNSNDSVRDIYNHFGITQSDISTMHDSAVTGQVTKGGQVIVNGKTVATNAKSSGRQNMSGSTAIHSGNTTFYNRSTSNSFAKSSLDAYVVMNNGQFSYAIVKSCGNPVTATPVQKPKAKPPKQKQQAAPQAKAQAIAIVNNAPPAAPPAPQPSAAACSSLQVVTNGPRTVTATVHATATNAQIIGYTVNFGDGFVAQAGQTPSQTTQTANTFSQPAPTTTDVSNTTTPTATTSGGTSQNTASSSNSNNTTTSTGGTNTTLNSTQGTTGTTTSMPAVSQDVSHTYSQDGTYNITASVLVQFPDGHQETETSAACQTSVSFNTPPPPAQVTPTTTPPQPAPPQELPSTGLSAENVVEISAAAALGGTLLHAIVIRRKYS